MPVSRVCLLSREYANSYGLGEDEGEGGRRVGWSSRRRRMKLKLVIDRAVLSKMYREPAGPAGTRFRTLLSRVQVVHVLVVFVWWIYLDGCGRLGGMVWFQVLQVKRLHTCRLCSGARKIKITFWFVTVSCFGFGLRGKCVEHVALHIPAEVEKLQYSRPM